MAEEKVIADRRVLQDHSESSDPTGLLYAPDRPRKARRARPRRPRPTLTYRKPDESGQPEQSTERKVEKMTLEEAFSLDFKLEDSTNDERAVRAASLLLNWATAEGCEEVDGILALGICRALDLAANNMALARQRSRKQAEDSVEDR